MNNITAVVLSVASTTACYAAGFYCGLWTKRRLSKDNRNRMLRTQPEESSMARYFSGDIPVVCEMCRAKIENVFSDAKLGGRTAWANVCDDCFRTCNCSYGQGHGQRYERQLATENTPERWKKTKG